MRIRSRHWQTTRPSWVAPSLVELFYQLALEIIKDELAVVVHQLYLLIPGCLVELNNTHIVLALEKKNSNKVAHFHLICLPHTFGRLFSKLLALHVMPRLPELIKENQSSFMLTTKGLHVRYIATLMLKVDIAKAFDSVSWPFLLWSHGHQHWQRIQRVGVDDSTVDTLNRVPGRHILYHHGMWQGDPLSLLFLLVLEVLNVLLVHAKSIVMLEPSCWRGVKHLMLVYNADMAVVLSSTCSNLILVARRAYAPTSTSVPLHQSIAASPRFK